MKHRYEVLDCVRGVAALIVVLNHFYNVIPALPEHNWLCDYTPVYYLIAGRMSVIVFFVLSGFVLALPYLSPQPPGYVNYITRRFCRIYLPFAVAIALAYTLWHAVAATYPEFAPKGDDWSHPVSKGSLLAHFLMTGTAGGNDLNPPIWSLIIEMRISIIFPLLMLLVRYARGYAVLLACCFGFAAAKVFSYLDGGHNFYMAESAAGAVFLTLYYVQFFVLGITLAVYKDQLQALLRSLPRFAHVLAILLILFVPRAWIDIHYTIAEAWRGVVAAYIILSCLTFATPQRWLSIAPARWLGKVSYSLYLIHLPVLLTILYGLHESLSLSVRLLIAFPLAFVAAAVMHAFVERPSIALGRMFKKKPAAVVQTI
ncbi:MAG TPA: acyltransferase [Rickettsiales bacterium]|nr:acyltransferase [Rickettsiales bacterium]